MGNCHPRKPMSTEAKPCQKYIELICNTSRRTAIIFRVSTWYSQCACNATCFPGYFGYLCEDECDCPVDQCDRKYGCRRNAPGRSLRKNMENIFLNTTFFPINYYFFLNSCDSSIALVRNEYTCIYIKICTLNQFGYLDKVE